MNNREKSFCQSKWTFGDERLEYLGRRGENENKIIYTLYKKFKKYRCWYSHVQLMIYERIPYKLYSGHQRINESGDDQSVLITRYREIMSVYN